MSDGRADFVKEILERKFDAEAHDCQRRQIAEKDAALCENSVLQRWVMALPRREQGTLLTGVRGCDLAPKPMTGGDDTPERQLTAFLRFLVMNPADAREVGVKGAFFRSSPPDSWKASQLGHYPQHWYSHLMHCYEVVGYRHPDEQLREIGLGIYKRLVHNMHLVPEAAEDMIARLSEDRIKSGTVVS